MMIYWRVQDMEEIGQIVVAKKGENKSSIFSFTEKLKIQRPIAGSSFLLSLKRSKGMLKGRYTTAVVMMEELVGVLLLNHNDADNEKESKKCMEIE